MTYVASVIGSNPQNYWRLNEGPGATAALDYGNQPGNLDLYIAPGGGSVSFGLPGFGFNGITADGGAMSVVGGGLWSPIVTPGPGASRYHSVPDPGTLEFWYFSEASISAAFIGWLAPKAPGGATALGFTVQDNLLTWNILGPGGPLVSVSPLSQWHHVAASWSLGTGFIYLDGTQIAPLTQPSNVAGSTVVPSIGPFSMSDPGYERAGLFTEVATYRRALTVGDLDAHFDQAELKGQRPHWIGQRPAAAATSVNLAWNYSIGVTHLALTGSGTFGVPTGLRGLKIDLIPPFPPGRVSAGTPPYLWDVGWLSVLDGNGILEEIRPQRDTQTWLPQRMSIATTVGYNLNPGWTIDVSELDPA